MPVEKRRNQVYSRQSIHNNTRYQLMFDLLGPCESHIGTLCVLEKPNYATLVAPHRGYDDDIFLPALETIDRFYLERETIVAVV